MNLSEQYKELLSKYLSGNITEEEKMILAQYLSQQELDEVLDQHILNSFHQTADPTAPTITPEASETILREILDTPTSTVQRSIFDRAFFKYGAAAAVIIGLVWGISQIFHIPANINPALVHVNPKIIQQFNQSDTIQEIYLADGSHISLHPKARITYAERMEDSIREVRLEGNAFFDVASNPDQPFIVRSKNLTTRVLGTSFLVSIDSKTGKEEVSVKSGKVQVSGIQKKSTSIESESISTVILLPNQKVIYEEEAQALSTTLVNHPSMIKAPSKQQATKVVSLFRYEQHALSSIVKDLEESYGVKINLAHENLGNCLFTGDLSEDDLFVKLKILCLSIGASYEIEGTTVVLNGTGCK